jgi:hypothetical protein
MEIGVLNGKRATTHMLYDKVKAKIKVAEDLSETLDNHIRVKYGWSSPRH